MKRIILVLLTTLLLSPVSLAQRRTRSTSTTPKPSAAETQRVAQVRTAGATRVAEQIKLLSKFIYFFGGVISSIAAVDEAVRRNEASPELAQQNQQAKTRVKGNIIGFREALDKLEIDFRATPELQPYYIKLAGVASGAATAEQQAGNNQFDAAGRSLLGVVNRLTDVLLVMR
ncbi:MAG TPA: hypothetical protein VGQ39_11105 [Pyrinomonadaceae bacterium]|nr:hypothetical protein [Pyrinomonadaceae bacterium]